LLQQAAAKKPSGSENQEACALAHLMDFHQLCEDLQVVYNDLDDFFVAWAGWMIDPSLLVDGTAQIRQLWDQWWAQAGQRCSAIVKASSFRGYLTAVGRAYSSIKPETQAVPSSNSQFSKFPRFFQSAYTRELTKKAANQAVHPPRNFTG
jgi:hypothetical protein